MYKNKKVLPLLLSLALCFIFAAGAFALEGEMAPLNPEFVKWQSEQGKARENAGTDGADPTGYKGGYTPEPVDWSHLGSVNYSSGGLLHNDRADDPLPVRFDLRDVDGVSYVTRVKDQSPYGTCWTFAALASLESTQLMRTGGPVYPANDFSEMHLAWFTYKDTKMPAFFIGQPAFGEHPVLDLGGGNGKTTAMLTRHTGPTGEAECGYTSTPSKASDEYPVRLNVTDVYRLHFADDPMERDETNKAIKKLLMTAGAVAMSYNSNYGLLNADKTAYYCSRNVGTDHLVTIVGWDDDYAVSNFNAADRPPQKGAWLIKNSWGTRVHPDGYFWLSYYDMSLGDAAQFRADSPDTIHKQKYIYDPLGYITGWGNKKQTSKMGANIFTAVENGQIEAVAFYTSEALLDYEVKLYTGVADGNPSSGTLKSTKAGSLTYAGYHTVKLTKPVIVEKGQKFSVVVKQVRQTGTGTGLYFPIEVPEADYAVDVTANAGESFLADVPQSGQQAVWSDLTKVDEFTKNANLCIRALGNPIPATGVTIDPTSLDLAPGATYTLAAEVAPSNATDKSVTWSSSNTAVATIDKNNGALTAVAAGNAIITVTANGAAKGATVEKTVTVKVETPTEPATEVTIDPAEGFDLYVGLREQLEAIVSPKNASNKSVEWTSSNPELVKVDSTGLVTAVAPGTATITAKALGTSDASVKASLVVTAKVTPEVIPIDVDPIDPDESGELDETITVQPIDGTPPTKVEIVEESVRAFEALGLSVTVDDNKNIVISGEPNDIGTFELEILITKSDGRVERQLLKITINPVDHTDSAIVSNITSWSGAVTRDGSGVSFEMIIPTDVSPVDAAKAKDVSAKGTGVTNVAAKFLPAKTTEDSARGAGDGAALDITGKADDLSSAVITEIVYRVGVHRYTKVLDVKVLDVTGPLDTDDSSGGGSSGCNASFAGFALILACGMYATGRLRRK